MNRHLGLNGKSILVTRPAQQATNLIQELEHDGATVTHNPAIEIVAREPQPTLASYQAYELVIFISRNAVLHGLDSTIAVNWPPAIRIAAIGDGTAVALQNLGLNVQLTAPKPYNSEALLNLPDFFACTNLNIAIVRGHGGREILGETLKARGAKVTYIECYTRKKPIHASAQCQQKLNQGPFDLIHFTSLEGLSNTVSMLEGLPRRNLLLSPVLVMTDEMIDKARALGFSGTITCADSPTDKDMVAASLAFFSAH